MNHTFELRNPQHLRIQGSFSSTYIRHKGNDFKSKNTRVEVSTSFSFGCNIIVELMGCLCVIVLSQGLLLVKYSLHALTTEVLRRFKVDNCLNVISSKR